jgi:hypothetical protein
VIARQLSPSRLTPQADGTIRRSAVTKLAFTMTPQDVAAVCPSSIKKFETPCRIGGISSVI